MSHFLSLLFLCFSLSIFAVEETKIDSYVSIEFPQKASKSDTMLAGIHTLFYKSIIASENYILQVCHFSASKGKENHLPTNNKALKEWYKTFAKGMMNTYYKMGIIQDNSIFKKLGSLITYEVNLKSAVRGIKTGKIKLLVVNGNLYLAYYFNSLGSNFINQNNFLNSFRLDTSKEPSQFVQESDAPTEAGKFVGIAVIMILIFAVFKRNQRRNRDYQEEI